LSETTGSFAMANSPKTFKRTKVTKMKEKSGVQWYWNRDGSKAEWRLATFVG
jgi:hypothetical protein